MPVYSFVCPVCGAHFDQRHSFQDDLRRVVCPNGHTGAHRVYSVPTVVYKGSGFYVTDSRKAAASAKATSKESAGD